MEEELKQEQEKTTNIAKCPECGANMEYSPKDQALKCPYCGTKVAVDFSKHSHELEFAELLVKHEEWDLNAVHVYRCNNCGAVEVLNKKDISLICPFCGTTNVIETNEISGIKPNGVVPFLIDVATATTNVINWAKKKFFAPRAFKKSVSPENVKGVYSPAFTFDANTASKYEGRLGRHETETVTRNGKTTTVTKTVYFHVSGNQILNFDDILIPASLMITYRTLEKLSSFDTNNSQEYSDEFLYGFQAEGKVRSGEECHNEAKQVMKDKIREAILKRYDYDVVDYLNVATNFSEETFKYLLLPIFIGHYAYRNKNYNFYVNGHNGVVTGKTPISVLKVTILSLIILAIIAVIVILVLVGGD